MQQGLRYRNGFIALPLLIFFAAVAVGVVVYFGGSFGLVVKNTTDIDNKVGEVVDEMAAHSTDSTSSPQASSGQFETDASNWQTYRNEEYGFEVKYPGDGQLSKFGENTEDHDVYIDFDRPGAFTADFAEAMAGTCRFIVRGYENPSRHDLTARFNQTFANSEGYTIESVMTSTMNNLHVLISQARGTAFITTANFIKPDLSTVGTVSFLCGPDVDWGSDLFDQILSTFKFIEN